MVEVEGREALAGGERLDDAVQTGLEQDGAEKEGTLSLSLKGLQFGKSDSF